MRVLNIFQKFIPLLALILIFSTISVPVGNAQNVESIESALNESAYYSVKTNEIVLNEQEALSLNPNISQDQISEVKEIMNDLTDDEIDTILINNGYEPEDVKLDEDLGHANIVWMIPITIGIIIAGGIIFSALYFSHKEKQNLINQCYKKGGYPKISSKDSAGIKGKTRAASAKKAGGYKFECKKKK